MTDAFRSSFRSIRGKLTLAAVTPLMVILLLVSLAASYLINASIVEQTQKQIRNDLNAARVVLEQEQQRLHEVVRFTARANELLQAVALNDISQISHFLDDIKQREQLDILNLTGIDGKPLLHNDQQMVKVADFVSTTLEQGHYHGTVLMSETELRRESRDLPKKAQIFAPGQSKIPSERRGMFLIASTLLLDAKGNPLGCLYGGALLNNNLPLIDRISELVYGDDDFEGVAIGSATIFLGKQRIATTVRLKNGKRAIGTKVSEEVAEAVLNRGEFWLARAKVVDEWYLTAYEPIFDDNGKALGALYVGMLEKPLTAVKSRSFMTLFGLLILGCLLGGLLSGYIARRLSRPLLALATSAEKIAGGERNVPLPIAGQDEVGHLTMAFADMTSALKRSDDELQKLNRQLEKKVEERTSQLEEKSLQLIKTQEQLLRHEKLAAIGSLATGVAHEINNPAAIIRGNVEILQMSLPADCEEQEEVSEIKKQVERVSLITRNLLNFAGKQELATDQVDLRQLLQEILAQISHQQPIDQVEIDFQLNNLPLIPGDRERLRQVFTNIVLNALQAMNGTGSLCVHGDIDNRQACLRISDTGPGIPEEIREKIFNPFFTTKKQGTGLGLSVSYGIIKAHGGSISIDSSEQGSSFLICLPLGNHPAN
ncbi:His Kinase A (phospho-acceptor) domain-containing protein [Malonomonas rubra DSM 5091]|uniref:histidine kinase n=1 Tax=Malonomonas rubra DSM 5091 TaxID=1122189 RepID=A0A1M6JQW6_MALRU|nr:HAMP domain-containing histidine kinase [Malonomonas rubra]SHJ49165.1 His Kinase A (phospho-acceptor) domain-containing protein [Malonomonas rubra DSM 5091]